MKLQLDILRFDLKVQKLFTPKHDGKAVDALMGSYRGFLVADAHSGCEHLYRDGIATGCACWAHFRRYVFEGWSQTPHVRGMPSL